MSLSTLVVVGLMVLVVYLYLTGGAQTTIVEVHPHIDQVRQEENAYYVPVTIENVGGETAESVRVEVSLTTSDGAQESSEMMVDFLAGDATEEATVVFSSDPRQGEVTANVLSYLMP